MDTTQAKQTNTVVGGDVVVGEEYMNEMNAKNLEKVAAADDVVNYGFEDTSETIFIGVALAGVSIIYTSIGIYNLWGNIVLAPYNFAKAQFYKKRK